MWPGGWGDRKCLTNRILTLDEVISIIDSVTADQLQNIARELIVDSKARLAVVGPIADPTPLQKILKI